MRIDYPATLTELMTQLKRLPGIGPRSAERIALWLVGDPESKRPTDHIADRAKQIGQAILDAAETIHPCKRCGFFALQELCEICQDNTRTTESICVVENATDILPIERTKAFRGYYHSLGGRLSPLEHVLPEHLRIEGLINRLKEKSDQATEVILALSADVEGEATAQYLAGLLKKIPNVTISRLAQGLPVGGGLEGVDELTLNRALTARIRL